MKKKINKSLYVDNHSKISTKGTGFKDKQKAIYTINIIKDRNITYQKQVINTMYNRDKYYPYQTEDMRDAMKIYKKWLKKIIKNHQRNYLKRNYQRNHLKRNYLRNYLNKIIIIQ